MPPLPGAALRMVSADTVTESWPPALSLHSLSSQAQRPSLVTWERTGAALAPSEGEKHPGPRCQGLDSQLHPRSCEPTATGGRSLQLSHRPAPTHSAHGVRCCPTPGSVEAPPSALAWLPSASSQQHGLGHTHSPLSVTLRPSRLAENSPAHTLLSVS